MTASPRLPFAGALVAASVAWASVPCGPELQIDEGPGSHGGAAVAAAAGGGFLVVWVGPDPEAEGTSVLARCYDAAGRPLVRAARVNARSSRPQGPPAVAAVAEGFIVTWWSDSGLDEDPDAVVVARRLDAAGQPLGDDFQVNGWTTGLQCCPDVAPDDASGGFVVVWTSEGGAGTDTDYRSVHGRRFTASGAPLGPQFQVNSYTPSLQFQPQVASNGAEGFVVVWTSYGSAGTDGDETSIQAQRYDGAGEPAGAEFQVNEDTAGSQYAPAVTADGSGGFLVAWHAGDVRARRFDAAGEAAGPEFRVNAYTPSVQGCPSVALDETAGFVVAWQSWGSDGTDDDRYSVQVRQLDATGAGEGPERQANTTTAGSQGGAAVALTKGRTSSSCGAATIPRTPRSRATCARRASPRPASRPRPRRPPPRPPPRARPTC